MRRNLLCAINFRSITLEQRFSLHDNLSFSCLLIYAVIVFSKPRVFLQRGKIKCKPHNFVEIIQFNTQET